MLRWSRGCTCLSEIPISFPSPIHPEVGLLDYTALPFLIFLRKFILFSAVAAPIDIIFTWRSYFLTCQLQTKGRSKKIQAKTNKKHKGLPCGLLDSSSKRNSFTFTSHRHLYPSAPVICPLPGHTPPLLVTMTSMWAVGRTLRDVGLSLSFVQGCSPCPSQHLFAQTSWSIIVLPLKHRLESPHLISPPFIQGHCLLYSHFENLLISTRPPFKVVTPSLLCVPSLPDSPSPGPRYPWEPLWGSNAAQ